MEVFVCPRPHGAAGLRLSVLSSVIRSGAFGMQRSESTLPIRVCPAFFIPLFLFKSFSRDDTCYHIAYRAGICCRAFPRGGIRRPEGDEPGFFYGNRENPWYVAALAMVGAAMSGVTFVSVPGSVAADSFSYMQMVAGFAVGQLIIAFVLIPLFYRLKVVSLYQYLDTRFGLTAHRTGAWFFFVSKILGAALRVYVVCVAFQVLVLL